MGRGQQLADHGDHCVKGGPMRRIVLVSVAVAELLFALRLFAQVLHVTTDGMSARS